MAKRNATKVERWGDDLAVRLPSELIRTLALREGDVVEVRIVRAPAIGDLVLAERNQLLADLRRFRGCLPADFRFDREDANAR